MLANYSDNYYDPVYAHLNTGYKNRNDFINELPPQAGNRQIVQEESLPKRQRDPSQSCCLLRPLQTMVNLDGQSQSAMSVMTWQQKGLRFRIRRQL